MAPTQGGWAVIWAASPLSEQVQAASGGVVRVGPFGVAALSAPVTELVAVIKALILLLCLPGDEPALLRTDNQAAGLQAVGWWTGDNNRALVLLAQRLAQQVRKRRPLWWRQEGWNRGLE